MDSPWSARYIYYFDGSDGCTECQALTGAYDNEPSRLHEGKCDCAMYEAVVWGFQSIIYKNKIESEDATYEMPMEAVAEYVNNSSNQVEHTFSISEMIEGEISVSAEIEEIFGVSGKFKGSETVSESVKVTLDPEEGVSIDVVGLLKTVTFSADKYAVYEPLINVGAGDADIPSTLEVFLEKLEDEIDAVDGHRIVTNDI